MGDIVIRDLRTGCTKVCLDAEYITAMRIGAVIALSIRLLQNQIIVFFV